MLISSFDRDILRNLEYRRHFNEKAFADEILMRDFYSQKVSRLDDVYNLVIPKCIECIVNSVNEAVSVLTENGIYDYDSAFFLNRFGISDNFLNDIDLIISKITEINDFQKDLQSARNIQRSSRSHWQGGGFGLGGAIKGALTAGLLNAGTGILRGIGDAFVNSGDNARINSIKREALQNGGFDDILAEAVYQMDVRIGYYICLILSEHGKLSRVIELVDEAALKRKLDNIKLQASKINPPMNKLVSEITGWIKQNPFSFQYYKCLYFMLGTKEPALNEICSILGYKNEFEAYKEIFAASIISGLQASNDDIKQKLNILQQVKSTYEFPELEQKQIAEIEYALTSQQKSDEEVSTQIDKSSFDELRADELIQSGKINEVWAMLDGENALIEYKLMQYYMNLVRPFIDRRDFRNIERRMSYVYELADKGNPFANFLINYIRRQVYINSSDKDRVIRIYEKLLKLADKSQLSACAMVGFYCYDGQGYFKRDYGEAFKYLSIAANKNHPTAMAWLGSMYLDGNGVPKDKQLAIKWLKLAAYYGHPYAVKKLENLN